MKVLLFNGSMHQKGTTFAALSEIEIELKNEGIDTEIMNIGNKPVRDCIACGGCAGKERCVFDDDIVNSVISAAEGADGFVFGTPVYYAHSCGRLLSLLDRAFYAGKQFFVHKPGAAVAVARRAGTTSAIEEITKHFTISQMPVVSSTYWNMVFGSSANDARLDGEGMQTMRNLGRNMAWLLKCIEAGKASGINPPIADSGAKTNFIR